ncbi:MAG: class I SAM-dependent methyltransferase [Proteobacteria bacterium]|nr:class I SAM-dependent methyltransferase [Pseudomonadota bacterium]
MTAERTNAPFGFEPSREFRAFHTFLAAARNHRMGPLYEQTHADYRRAGGNGGNGGSAKDVLGVIDNQPSYQLYAWAMRHLQQFKYDHADFGVVPAIGARKSYLRQRLRDLSDEGIGTGELTLDPDLDLPDYFTMTDFHQHPGGVAGNPLAGLAYEMSRAIRFKPGADSNDLYRNIFSYLPADRDYRRMLDWGTSFGAGVRTWLEAHPGTEAHGVDLSEPCLRLAYVRARERNMTAQWRQQDVEHLSYPDGTFDVALFAFMLHEFPAARFPALFKEAARVLSERGVFVGFELAYVAGSAFQNTLQDQEGWLNDEPFMPACFKSDFQTLFREAGFSKVTIRRFDQMADNVTHSSPDIPKRQTWNIYVAEK